MRRCGLGHWIFGSGGQGSLSPTHFLGIKQCKYMVVLRDLPQKKCALFGLVSYNDPWRRRMLCWFTWNKGNGVSVPWLLPVANAPMKVFTWNIWIMEVTTAGGTVVNVGVFVNIVVVTYVVLRTANLMKVAILKPARESWWWFWILEQNFHSIGKFEALNPQFNIWTSKISSPWWKKTLFQHSHF